MVEKKYTKIKEQTALMISISGLVQGVGFRPFVYRLAKQFELNGWVKNRNDGVQIKVEGNSGKINQFISHLKEEAPIAANIEFISQSNTEIEKLKNFSIIKSKNTSDEITQISPDIAVCPECLKDLKEQPNRKNYPFINCTNCGPRFSIIKDLPYDRAMTTMATFQMCDDCKKEYEDILDRRFHAQPVACNHCGPEYELHFQGTQIINFKEILKIVADLISDGKILAVKGIGGFHLACDAMNGEAVKRLRFLKNREGKPFAVMCRDIETIKKFATVEDQQELLLKSWQRPIVLLKENENSKIPVEVSNGLSTIGVMLPYMPFHHLLFEQLKTPAIVLTSGNISDEPIVIDNDEAKEKLTKISDALLIHNRDIYNRTDDSVMMTVNNRNCIIRRSRGFVPTPILLKMNVEGIIATGAELKNTFCVGKNNMAILSQHIGDLKNLETYEFYTQTIEQFKKLFRVKSTLFVSDLHPDYLSSKYLNKIASKKILVQHHHAHIASCMAEHGLDEKVIGVSFDGTGYGDDGNTWGSEFFVCDLNEYERISHFEYIPMPGGDKVSEEPWRMAVSYLFKYFGKEFMNLDLPFLKKIRQEKISLLILALENKINCPLTSGAGRLFDAVAALLNICTFANFEAEGPIRMESIIEKNSNEKYLYSLEKNISFEQTFKELIDDIKNNIPNPVVSAKFHNTIISVILDVVKKISEEHRINKVVLSGGVFQNTYLLENIEKQLIASKLKVYTHSKVPSNDGGIALGQLAIAAKRRTVSQKL